MVNKLSNTLFKISLAESLLFMQLFLKMLSGMANSEDLNQTAQFDLGLHGLHMPFCRKLRC